MLFYGSKDGISYGFFSGVVTRVQTGTDESGMPVYEEQIVAPFEGAVEVTEEEWETLLAGQNSGKVIVRGEDGRPSLADPPDTPDPVADALDMLAKLQRQTAIRSIPLDDDASALIVAPVCPEWAAGQNYKAGDILNHNGTAYRVAQDVLSLGNQPPDADGMLAIYRPISLTSSGTIDDPVPFENGMDVTKDLYYSYNGKVYLAKADMLPCVWPPDTAGLWQWEEVK